MNVIKTFPYLIGKCGLFNDGDWIESKDQDPNGDVRLIQLADIGVGNFINKSSRFMTSDKAKELKCTYLRQGDILIARMPDPIGRACIFPNIDMPCVTVVDICIVRVDPKIVDSNWLVHFINSNNLQRQISSWITGTTRQRISRGNLSKVEIPLPPLEEQKRIAAILDKADALRRKRQQAIDLTDQLLRSVFLDMFGDPVTNPKKLEIAKMSEIGQVITGNTPSRKKPEYYGSDVEWIKSDNINTPCHYLTQAEEYLSDTGVLLGRTVPENSILVTCIAGSKDCIGNIAIADRVVAFNQQINAIVPNEKILTLFLYAQLAFNKKLVQKASTESMKGMVSKSKFSDIEVLLPSIKDQEKYVGFFNKALKKIKAMKTAMNNSDHLFDSLTQQAFRGELIKQTEAA